MYIYVASSACLTTLFTVYPRNKAISTRETVDFIKLTVHARYSGVSLERREKNERKFLFFPWLFSLQLGDP